MARAARRAVTAGAEYVIGRAGIAVVRSLDRDVIGQGHHPLGAAGSVTGWVFAHRPSNRQRLPSVRYHDGRLSGLSTPCQNLCGARCRWYPVIALIRMSDQHVIRHHLLRPLDLAVNIMIISNAACARKNFFACRLSK